MLGDKPNQIAKQRSDVQVTAKDLLDFRPEAPITEGGLRNNINVGIHYLGAWLAGNGCVPIHNLMEDAATAEISRSQVWQWIRSPKGKLDDGRKVTAELVRDLTKQELDNVKKAVGGDTKPYDRAAQIFEEMSTSKQFTDFPDAAAIRGHLTTMRAGGRACRPRVYAYVWYWASRRPYASTLCVDFMHRSNRRA